MSKQASPDDCEVQPDGTQVGSSAEVMRTPRPEREPASISPRSRGDGANLQQCQLSWDLPSAASFLRYADTGSSGGGGTRGEGQVSNRQRGPPCSGSLVSYALDCQGSLDPVTPFHILCFISRNPSLLHHFSLNSLCLEAISLFSISRSVFLFQGDLL